MRNDVLSEYLSLVVERIRSQRGVKGLTGDRFDMKRFKSLPGTDTMIYYADKFLQKLGKGSSRIAFLMSGKYALKIALNQKGLSQNEAELDVCTNPASKAVVAKIYDFDDKHRWLISDLVREISNEAEFKSLTGVRWTEEFCVWMSHGIRMKKIPENLPDDMEIVRSTIKMAIANNLLPGDITKLEHWGKTADGRVVLLDYGFTEDVYQSHYRKDKPANNWPAGHDTEATTMTKKAVGKDVADAGHAKTHAAEASPTLKKPQTAASDEKTLKRMTRR